MQQQSSQPMKSPPLLSSIPNIMTTEDVQKCLEENKRLILAIMENQSLGRVTEVAPYQAQLQRNLMYLAAIADAQLPATPPPSQTPQQSVVQQEYPIQQSQPATAQQQQPSVLTPNLPFQLNNFQSQDQQHQLLLQQQQLIQGQMGMGLGPNTSMHQFLQTGIATSGGLGAARRSNQDLFETGSGGDRDLQL